MSGAYQKMLDDAFKEYYDRFKELNATSREKAVTMKELFPNGRPLMAGDRMHKMLSFGVVKRVGLNKYWLDEDKASDGNGILKERLLIFVAAIGIALILLFLDSMGIINFK